MRGKLLQIKGSHAHVSSQLSFHQRAHHASSRAAPRHTAAIGEVEGFVTVR